MPLSGRTVERVVDKLAHRVDWLRPTGLLAAADLAAWDRLLDPADAATSAAAPTCTPSRPAPSTPPPAP